MTSPTLREIGRDLWARTDWPTRIAALVFATGWLVVAVAVIHGMAVGAKDVASPVKVALVVATFAMLVMMGGSTG